MVSQSTSLCPVVLGYVLWFLDAGFTVRTGWYNGAFCDAMINYVMSTPGLWCHGVFSMWSVMPWCILWCHHDVCDAMMYSVMWSVVPWCILWCQDMWDDFVMSRHVPWCCVSFCDSCDWKGTGGKTQTNRSWNGVASELAVPTCLTGNALMPTALSWGVNSIYLLWNYGRFPPHHPPRPPSHHSISVHHAPPPIHLQDKKHTLWTWCFQFQAAGPLRKRQCE